MCINSSVILFVLSLCIAVVSSSSVTGGAALFSANHNLRTKKVPSFYDSLLTELGSVKNKINRVRNELNFNSPMQLSGAVTDKSALKDDKNRIRLMKVNREALVTKDTYDNFSTIEPMVKLGACSCKDVFHSVHDLNTMRRWDSVEGIATSGKTTSANREAGLDVCPICLEKYDYDALNRYSASGTAAVALGDGGNSTFAGRISDMLLAACKVLLETDRNLALRPMMITTALAASITLLLYSSAILGSLGQFALGLAGIVLKFASQQGIKTLVTSAFGGVGGALYSLTVNRLSDMVRHGEIVAQNIGKSNIWLRIATSKTLWQQFPVWSIVTNLPIVLQLFLGNILLRQLGSMWLDLEKSVVRRLIDTESGLIENNIVSAFENENV